MAVAPEMLEIAVGDLTFRGRVAGPVAAPVALFLHGFPQTSRCWAAQMAAVAAAGYRAVAVDQRGYSPGARPADPAAYALPNLVGDVLGIIDALGADAVDLVGHDFGGSVAWAVAGHRPDRVRTLTIASTPHPRAFVGAYQAEAGRSEQRERSGYMRVFRETPRGELEAQMLADGGDGLRSVFRGLPDEAVAEYVDALSGPGALVAAVDWYRSMSAKASAAVPSCAVPTLYVWSDRDPAIGRAAAEATEAHVDGPYRFVELHDVGHWIPELAAGPFSALLLEHLSVAR
jgi:pimeloyl-ACP methyl ester carboxylesterase